MGIAFLKVETGEEAFLHKFVITLDTQCILGTDYLNQHIKTISMTKRSLDTKRGRSLPLYGRKHGDLRVRVINSIDCRTPPRHKCIVMAKTDSEVQGVVIV
jgi:hypothetical protein